MVSKNIIKIILMLGILFIVGCSGQNGEEDSLLDGQMEIEKSITFIGEATAESKEEKQDKEITKEEVAKHDSTDDCWIIFGGEVYDISSFISNHQGRNVMLEGCGREATELFIVEKMGFENLQTALARLQDYKI